MTSSRICSGNGMARSGLPYDDYARLGMQMSMHLESVCSYEHIALELDVSVQRAHQIAMIALGKLAYGLKKQLQPPGIKRVHI